jgi:hypothetical protein
MVIRNYISSSFVIIPRQKSPQSPTFATRIKIPLSFTPFDESPTPCPRMAQQDYTSESNSNPSLRSASQDKKIHNKNILLLQVE